MPLPTPFSLPSPDRSACEMTALIRLACPWPSCPRCHFWALRVHSPSRGNGTCPASSLPLKLARASWSTLGRHMRGVVYSVSSALCSLALLLALRFLLLLASALIFLLLLAETGSSARSSKKHKTLKRCLGSARSAPTIAKSAYAESVGALASASTTA